jgi:hypothetical protein
MRGEVGECLYCTAAKLSRPCWEQQTGTRSTLVDVCHCEFEGFDSMDKRNMKTNIDSF